MLAINAHTRVELMLCESGNEYLKRITFNELVRNHYRHCRSSVMYI